MGLTFSNIIIYYIQHRNNKNKDYNQNKARNIINIPNIYTSKQVELKTILPNSVT